MRSTFPIVLATAAAVMTAGCGGSDSAAGETVMSDLGGDPAYQPVNEPVPDLDPAAGGNESAEAETTPDTTAEAGENEQE